VLCARGVCQAAGASDGHHVGIPWSRQVRVIGCLADEWYRSRQQMIAKSVYMFVRLCVCLCVKYERECVCLRVNAKHQINAKYPITNKAFLKNHPS